MSFPFQTTPLIPPSSGGQEAAGSEIEAALHQLRTLAANKPARPYVFTSSACRSDHFKLPLYAYWCERTREAPAYHRKQWEFVFIAHALFERGFLKEGSRGIGFGVGKEPLSDLFASFGCRVVATDLSAAEAAGTGWIETDQHANSRDSLFRGISGAEQFQRLVSFETVNMNAIPEELRDFDFCYSSCSMEHVGSLEKSKAFLLNSLRVLRPGGLSIHTTEMNVTSDTETIDSGSTVLWRRCDFEEVASGLRQAGHSVEPLVFDLGAGAVDRYVDVPPYRREPHLKLDLGKFASTSFGIIVAKSP